MESSQKLFQMIAKNEWPAVLTLWGQDDYLHREMRNSVRAAGFDFQGKDLKKKGPESEDEDLSYSTSLFQSSTFVWLQTQASPDRWSAESQKIWSRMVTRADPQSLVLCLQVMSASTAKGEKSKGSSSKLDIGKSYEFDVAPESNLVWLKRMNQVRNSVLDEKKLLFLSTLEASLMDLDQYVELWSLGGDAWAEVALSYGESSSRAHLRSSSNPAYDWVDALLNQNPSKALHCLSLLLSQGQDPLQLLGLVSKTLKIWAYLEKGVTPQGEAPFLIDKVRRAMSKQDRGAELASHKLSLAARLDVLVKSRPVDSSALLVQLSSY